MWRGGGANQLACVCVMFTRAVVSLSLARVRPPIRQPSVSPHCTHGRVQVHVSLYTEMFAFKFCATATAHMLAKSAAEAHATDNRACFMAALPSTATWLTPTTITCKFSRELPPALHPSPPSLPLTLPLPLRQLLSSPPVPTSSAHSRYQLLLHFV